MALSKNELLSWHNVSPSIAIQLIRVKILEFIANEKLLYMLCIRIVV